jgi:hypothetical protein
MPGTKLPAPVVGTVMPVMRFARSQAMFLL